MADYNKTATSGTAPVGVSGADVLTKEAFKNALARTIQKTYELKIKTPIQGEQFFRKFPMNFDTQHFQSYFAPQATIPMNRDTDDMASIMGGDGFPWDLYSYGYRAKISIERKLQEIDDRGIIAKRQSWLADGAVLTKEMIYADVFNRAFGATGYAPVLADDGMYLIDSSRPNPRIGAGLWSNLQATAAISETSLFTAALAARQQVSENNVLMPMTIKKIVIPPAQMRNMWVLLKSTNKVNSANNDANWANDAFSMDDVIVYDRLTSSYIFYWLCDPKSQDNDLVLGEREPVTFATYAGDDPDVVHQRVRFDIGIGLGSPRRSIMGGIVS